MILSTYSAILSDTHVFRDKGNLSFASPPSHLSIGRLTCGVTNCFMTARMLETIYFGLDLQRRLSNAISSKRQFSLFLPLFSRNYATYDWLCWQLPLLLSPAQPPNNSTTVPSPCLLAAYSGLGARKFLLNENTN